MIRINYVDGITYFGDMENGVSKPKKIMCDDGIIRVVKFNHPENWNRALLHEYIGYQIARWLCLPVLEQTFVNIPIEMAKVYSSIEGMSSGIKIGTPFSNIDNNIAENGLFREPLHKLYGSCANKDDLVGVLVFDIWMHNSDRGSNKGNLLILPQNDGTKKLFLHDHGFCLAGPTSDMNRYKTLTELRDSYLTWQNHKYPFAPVYEAIKLNIDLTDSSINPFYTIVKKIESITKEELLLIVSHIPKEWDIPDYEINAIINFLFERRYTIKNAINNLVKIFWFTNWDGGMLNWQESHVSMG